MASGDSVQKIKDRLSIVDVVAPYVELHQAGKSFKGKSPFTNEKTPSFYVSPDRGMYYCFSTSQGGDIFTFIQVMEGVDFKGALKILAEKAGVELVPEDPKKKSERDRQYDVLEEATKFFQQKLGKEDTALRYLEDRGLKPETRARWRVGYAPGPPHYGWRELKTHLEEKKFTKEEMVRAGLIKGLDTGKEPYDVFRDRVMFPIMDNGGRVVAYSGRILSKDSDAPKYVNSPETELFVKSDILFGYDKAKEGIRKLNFSLIVEGQFDVVLSHQAGYNNTVAVSGTALTPHHVDLLQRLSNRVVLALDDDRAGIAAVKRAADLMLSRSMDVKVAKMEEGKDPADMIKDDVETFKDAIKSAVPVVEYLLDILARNKRDERTYKLQVREEVLPYVAKIPNAIDREHFEGVIAKRLSTTQGAIHAEVQKLLESRPLQTHHAISGSDVQPAVIEKTVDDAAAYVFGAIAFLERFDEGAAVVAKLREVIRQNLDQEYEAVLEKLSEERLNPVMIEFEKTYEQYPDRSFFENFLSRLNHFHERVIRKQIAAERKVMEKNEEASTEHQAAQKRVAELASRLANHQLDLETISGKND